MHCDVALVVFNVKSKQGTFMNMQQQHTFLRLKMPLMEVCLHNAMANFSVNDRTFNEAR